VSIRERYQQIESVTKYSNYYLGKCYTWLSTPITERAASWGWHPNVLTLLSLAIALVATSLFLVGETLYVVIGAFLLYVSYVLDWCDGQLARFTGQTSPFGGWLDQMCDRIKEFAYVTSLAYGNYRQTGDTSVFLAALLALFFLFLLEYYGQMNRAIPSVESASASASVQESPRLGPVKRVVIDFSIDEQYFFVVVGAIILGAKYTLYGIVLLAGLMAIYKPLKGWMRYYAAKRGGHM
jgi:archaetidylinositol phosphate synthase